MSGGKDFRKEIQGSSFRLLDSNSKQPANHKRLCEDNICVNILFWVFAIKLIRNQVMEIIELSHSAQTHHPKMIIVIGNDWLYRDKLCEIVL